MASKIKNILWFCTKIAIAGGIISYMFYTNRAGILEGLKNFNYYWLIPAALLYWGHMVVCALRWQSLTKVLNIKLSLMEAISLTMQGYFFSLVMPGGAIGGDVIKITVLSTRTPPGEKLEGAFSILMDRIVGMIALFLLAIVVTIPAIPILMEVNIAQYELSSGIKILGIIGIFGLCISGLFASFIIFFHKQVERIWPFGFFMKKADEWTKGMVTRVTTATDHYRKKWQVVLNSVIISIPFVHLLTVVVFACIVAGLGTGWGSMIGLIAAITIGNIAGLIPIFPAGIGGRDFVIITILVAAGMAAKEAKTAQLLYTALILSTNALCGLFFIFDSGKGKLKSK